jgi:hypothetical protein
VDRLEHSPVRMPLFMPGVGYFLVRLPRCIPDWEEGTGKLHVDSDICTVTVCDLSMDDAL